MDEIYDPEQPIDLHSVPALKEIEVRKGVQLRPLAESDADRVLEVLAADSSIRENVSVAAQLHTPEDVTVEVERYQNNPDRIRYAILDSGRFVGLVSLSGNTGFFGPGTENPNEYYFGYFVDPNERGKGLVPDAVQKLMDTTAKNVHVEQFIAFCADSNEASIRVLTDKLGFTPGDELLTEPNTGWQERKYTRAA